MNNTHIQTITSELSIRANQVTATITLLDDASTVPFIARYRKEATGELDEVAITAIRDRLKQLRDLDERREAILKSLIERDLLTDDLKTDIDAATTMSELEDIYLPYKPKRRTRATIAREKGLEPLAEIILKQEQIDLQTEANNFINEELGVTTTDEALAGARDIIAEWINEDPDLRADIRDLYQKEALITSTVIKGKESEGAKFSDYFEWSELLRESPSHRVLAMRRGETEGILRLSINPDEEEALPILLDYYLDGDNDCTEQVRIASSDCYKRLLGPSMETEMFADSKFRSDETAISVFAENLRELLMVSPLGQKTIMALDPGFRTGCKVVCLDSQGKLLHNDTIYPHTGDAKRKDAGKTVKELCKKHKIEVIAIGNGTAGRESVTFVNELGLENIDIELVNESGASIYSASQIARDEFPDHDITVRGAVSIGRRLMDPLAELVKIDPKSIGVGQYQHDVEQTALKRSLDDTVMSCVNAVGVELNTASKQLLTYVSGLGPTLAQNIVTHREENGPFKSRAALKKVPRLGPKAFEQSAGFLRIASSSNPLDRSAVHPERYKLVDSMANDAECTPIDLINDDTRRKRIKLERYVSDNVGMPTLLDIMQELARPGRDPRPSYESFKYDENVNKIEDLKSGMTLPGIVTNVTAFGAFVDVGVHQDGLVHISQLADKFVKDPSDIVKVQQKVKVRVVEVDIERKRISLSMRTEH